ncbi:MAG: ATP-dependent RNA helicase HrpA [Planctomycetota bacterium]
MLREDPQRAAEAIQRSKDLVERRRSAVPNVSYPPGLPFSERVRDIADAVSDSQVVVLCGETGSGKSTQLPKLCLETGLGVSGIIGHTQPRRLAARSVASRIAEELGVRLGDEVGSKVRFSDQTSDRTLIKVLTDGMLLAESRSDRILEQYDAIIVDEAHERSLNIDFLLGTLSRVLVKRSDLKVIITSATIDPDRFAAHFAAITKSDVPVIEVSGRTFPVEIEHHAPMDESGRPLDLPEAIAEAAERLAIKDGFGSPGDVLVFLPGERDIREAARELRRRCEQTRLLAGTEIVPLYARLSYAEQRRVFTRSPRRRIVLATNVAETSLTVPGIRYVIDSGLARISRYSPRRRVQSLQIEPISQASARQRAGRCGRTEPGTCIRLYSEDDHAKRDEFTLPEIQRTNLAGVILQMRSLNLGDPRQFPFLDPPEPRRINEAYDTLYELRAVDQNQQITKVGEQMARLPIDPRLARMLIEARDEGVLSEALIVASALETQDPRERPVDARDAADAKHARFRDASSDFVTLINLWDYFHERKDQLSRSQLRKVCGTEFISFVRMNEWTDTHRQLRDAARALGWKPGRRAKQMNRDALHRSVLAGSLTTVGKRHDDGGFVSPVAGVFHVHPGSAVSTKGARWMVSAELVRTTRLFARLCATIDGEWVEQLASHLIQREYSEIAYAPERGRVEASAKVTLGQIELSRDRRVDYSGIDRAEARRVFIREALVEQQLSPEAEFVRVNQAFLEDLRVREAKLRRPQMPSDAALEAFFDARVPADVCTARAFDRWRRKAEAEEPSILFMTPEQLDGLEVEDAGSHLFPDSLEVSEGRSASLVYRLEPGDESDGIEAVLSVPDAAAARPESFDWLIPAWMPDKVEAIVRGLPKAIRRQFEPAELAQRILADAPVGESDLFTHVADTASRITGLRITPAMCRAVDLPPHLQMSGRVVDADGNDIATGRDFTTLIAAARARQAKQLEHDARNSEWTSWPARYDRIYPPRALVDSGRGVRVVTCGDETTARVLHWFGCRRLVGLACRSEIARLLEHTPHASRLHVHLQTLDDAADTATEIACLLPEVNRPVTASVPCSHEEFETLIDTLRSEMGTRLTRIVSLLASALDERQKALVELERARSSTTEAARRDADYQLRQLIHIGSLRRALWDHLIRLPAYLRGITTRLERLRGDGIQRDRAAMARVIPHWTRCLDRARQDAAVGRERPALQRYRWMIEEYRLSLFAPSLALRNAASERLLDRAWSDVERDVA